MYDFNIADMLSAYDNDPNALADAFTNALNTELEKRNEPEEDITRIAAGDVAGLWNDYIYFYCQQKGLSDSINIEDFEITPDTILAITELGINSYTYIHNLISKFRHSEEIPEEPEE